MQKENGRPRDAAVTRVEALRLLGVRKGALVSLEKAAKIRPVPGREGYSHRELKRLVATLKLILRR